MANSDSFERAVDEDCARDGGAGCPECGGSVWTNTIETVCADCGLVIESQPIDHGPEWRSFEDDETAPPANGGATHADAPRPWLVDRDRLESGPTSATIRRIHRVPAATDVRSHGRDVPPYRSEASTPPAGLWLEPILPYGPQPLLERLGVDDINAASDQYSRQFEAYRRRIDRDYRPPQVAENAPSPHIVSTQADLAQWSE